MTRASETDEEKFRRLVAEWRRDVRFTSSMTERIANARYRLIINMGEVAIPMLLAEMKRAPDDWSWALHVLTGADPVPEDDAGDLERTASAWLEWGRRMGYRS